MKGGYLSDDFFDRLERLALNLPTTLTGYFGGKHKINKYGQTIEFADFREYELGDDIRRIDWNLYARLGKYFLKLFTDERQMHVRIYIDCSSSMGFYPDKGEYALAIAAAFGYLAIRNNDKVSFHFLRNGTADSPFGVIVGKNAFYGAVGKFKEVEFSGEADFEKTIPNIPDMSTNDGLAVIISDFLTDNPWQKAVDYFVFKKQQVLICQVLDKEESSPTYGGKVNLIDCEGSGRGDERNVHLSITHASLRAYKKELENYISEIKNFCSSRDAAFLYADTNIPIEKAIFGQLSQYDLVR